MNTKTRLTRFQRNPAWLQWVATALAITGVILNNGRQIECFVVWIVSNALTGWIHAWSRMWGLVVRDVVFLVLAVVGWWCWANTNL